MPDQVFTRCPAVDAGEPHVARTLAWVRRAKEGLPPGELTAAELDAFDVAAREVGALRGFQERRAIAEASEGP